MIVNGVIYFNIRKIFYFNINVVNVMFGNVIKIEYYLYVFMERKRVLGD